MTTLRRMYHRRLERDESSSGGRWTRLLLLVGILLISDLPTCNGETFSSLWKHPSLPLAMVDGSTTSSDHSQKRIPSSSPSISSSRITHSAFTGIHREKQQKNDNPEQSAVQRDERFVSSVAFLKQSLLQSSKPQDSILPSIPSSYPYSKETSRRHLNKDPRNDNSNNERNSDDHDKKSNDLWQALSHPIRL